MANNINPLTGNAYKEYTQVNAMQFIELQKQLGACRVDRGTKSFNAASDGSSEAFTAKGIRFSNETGREICFVCLSEQAYIQYATAQAVYNGIRNGNLRIERSAEHPDRYRVSRNGFADTFTSDSSCDI